MLMITNLTIDFLDQGKLFSKKLDWRAVFSNQHPYHILWPVGFSSRGGFIPKGSVTPKSDATQPTVRLQLGTVWKSTGRRIALWSPYSQQKVAEAGGQLCAILSPILSPLCMHVKGRGGVKETVRIVQTSLKNFPFVARFDIASYYDSIVHDVLLQQLEHAGTPPHLMEIVRQYLELPDSMRTGRGLVAGGALSPLLGALYLFPLDNAMERLAAGNRIVYRRFMDDFVIISTSRHRLRRAILCVHIELEALGLTLSETKRFIGRSTTGFDFLGYQFHPLCKLRPSQESIRRLKERARRLYEQGASINRLRQYVERWHSWFEGALNDLVSRKGGCKRYMVWVFIHLNIWTSGTHQHS